MRRRFSGFFYLILIIQLCPAILRGQPPIRMGTLAPRDSAWHQLLKEMGFKWQQSTGGRVSLQIFPGGVVGDEGEMIRKMRIGQLQAAAISNAGLADIDRMAYSVMLPLMFESYEEWDYVRDVINKDLEAALREKGFTVLAWSDVGWVYFFSKQPLLRPDQLKEMKLAASPTEPVSVDIMKWANFNPVPISTPDLVTGLQTGLIDAFYVPLILAQLSNLYRDAGHMSDLKWAPLQGALVMHENGWKRLSPRDQEAVLEVSREIGARWRSENRRQEEASLEAMKARGLEVHTPSESELQDWRNTVSEVYPRIRGRLVPEELFDKAVRLRDEYRASGRQTGQ